MGMDFGETRICAIPKTTGTDARSASPLRRNRTRREGKMKKTVHVELGDSNLPIRIFRTKDWRLLPADRVRIMDKAEAVGCIRFQVYNRAEGKCESCDVQLTWATGELNEIRPKGAGGGLTGGEVSLTNCEWLCHACHQVGPGSRHANRRWQTARLRGYNERQ